MDLKCSKTTYLDVLIDKHLRWNLHTAALKNKNLRYVLVKIKLIKDILKQLKIICYILVESSKLRYNNMGSS